MFPFSLDIIEKTKKSASESTLSSIDKVFYFINEDREEEGKNDAKEDAIMQDGIDAIIEEVKQLCNKEMKRIERDIIGIDEQIKMFTTYGHIINASEYEIYKARKEKEKEQIDCIMKELNENIPVVASYKKGFKKVGIKKIKGMTTENMKD
jgi:hypothetical protein